MTARVRRFLMLAPGDRGLLLRAVPLVAALRLGLWLLPFRTLRGLVTGLGRETAGAGRADEAGRIAWAVGAATRVVPRAATCLVRALAAEALLRRRGLPARLYLGMGRGDDGRLSGHAWVESGGRIVAGGPLTEGYTFLRGFEREPS